MKRKSILDPKFKYVPSYETDIRRTFEKFKRKEKAAEPENVVALPPRQRKS